MENQTTFNCKFGVDLNTLPQSFHSPFDNLHLAKYRKVLNTFVIVCVFLLTFYTPFLIASFLTALYGVKEVSERTMKLSSFVAMSELLVYFTATLNPLLYSWRMIQLKKAIKTVLARMACGRCISTVGNEDDRN